MSIFNSTYTLPIAVLLTVLIVIGCAPEEPALVATAAPTNFPTFPPSQTRTPTPVPPVPPESTARPQLQTFKIGDTVRLGDLPITVNGVRASLGDNFSAPEEGTYFIYVDVTFRNQGDQPEVVSTLLQMEIRDAEGRSYDVDIYAIAASGSSQLDGAIAPGGSLKGEVSYQLPTSATDLTWRFSGDILRAGQAIFSLGTVAVPLAPPGFTLDDPLPAGGILPGSDGTEIRVLGIIPDARRQVAEGNSFNDPPEEGMRFYMIRLEVIYPEAASGSVNVAAWDFSLIGDNRVVYSGPLTSISCGVIPDPLGSIYGEGYEIFAGGHVEGNICFEIPEDEDGLILIHAPGYGIQPRRFLSLTYPPSVPTSTPQPEPTAILTPTHLSTSKPSSTPTHTPTRTPEPTLTPTPIPSGRWQMGTYEDSITGNRLPAASLNSVAANDDETTLTVYCSRTNELAMSVDWEGVVFVLGTFSEPSKAPVRYFLDGTEHFGWWVIVDYDQSLVPQEDLYKVLNQLSNATDAGFEVYNYGYGDSSWDSATSP